MTKAALASLVLVASSSCVHEVAIIENVTQNAARNDLNKAKHDCMLPGATHACTALGDKALHVTAQTQAVSWTEARDPVLAHMAYVRGCANGEGRSCAALLEYGLAVAPPEQAWARRRVAYLHAKVRGADEVRDDDRQARQEAGDISARHEASLERAAERDAESSAAATQAFGVFVQSAPSIMQTHPPVMTQPPVVTHPAIVTHPPVAAHPPMAPPSATPSSARGPSATTTPAPRPPTRPQSRTELREAQLDNAVELQKQQQAQLQQQAKAANAAALAEQQRKVNLASCLATDHSCPTNYGTSLDCVPSVPYTDRFGGRGSVQAAHLRAQMYSGPDMGAQWIAEYHDRIGPLLEMADPKAMVQLMDQFGPRKNALSAAVLVGYPTCSAPDSSTDQVRFWCANRRADCFTHTDSSALELECARQQDQFLYYAEFKQQALDLHAHHESECHQKFGY